MLLKPVKYVLNGYLVLVLLTLILVIVVMVFGERVEPRYSCGGNPGVTNDVTF